MPKTRIDPHFSKSVMAVRMAYEAIFKAARAFGPVREEPKKTSIHLVRETAFAGVATRRDFLILTLKSTTRIRSKRVHRAGQLSAHRWQNEIRVHSPRDVDRELRSWLAASYELAKTPRKSRGMPRRGNTIDEYLAALTPDKRATLQKLRRAIHAAAPGLEECISYSMPGFRLNGKVIAWFGAGANHLAMYPGAYPIVALKDELKKYETSKGTIRFPIDKPLPAPLVRKLIKASIANRGARSRK